MSDNEDERMDRAKRIRQMREGGNREPDRDHSEGDMNENGGDDTNGDSTDGKNEGESTAENESDGTTTDEGSESVDGDESDTGELDVGSSENAISAPLPESDELEAALDGAAAESDTEVVTPEEVGETPTPPGENSDEETAAEKKTRVLEFTLDDEHYCLDIEYIEEIVKEETITRVPNTPEFVEGVVDLRGQITTILNPKVTIGKETVEPGELIVVFDADAFDDQGHIGWVVDDVRQVSPITESEVNEPPIEAEYINGVLDREDDGEFVIWTTPEMAMESEDA